MDPQTVAIPAGIALGGVGLIAYFLKRAFEDLAKDVRLALDSLSKHDTRLSLLEGRQTASEAEAERQRARTHELFNTVQGIQLRKAPRR